MPEPNVIETMIVREEDDHVILRSRREIIDPDHDAYLKIAGYRDQFWIGTEPCGSDTFLVALRVLRVFSTYTDRKTLLVISRLYDPLL